MKMQIVSDLHLDWGDHHLPGGEVLVMAGDIFEVRHITKPTSTLDRYHRFCHHELTKYDHVVYVFGNHEYYGGHYDRTKGHIQAILPTNTQILDGQSTTINGIRIWGGTLWTDFNRANPVVMNCAVQEMNDYHQIRWKHYVDGYWTSKFTPQDVLTIHQQQLSSLLTHLEDPAPTTVVTHHAPTHMSTDRRQSSDYYYYTDLSNLILDHPHINYWIHGHTHQPHNYLVGTTRVICNPRGYQHDRSYLPLEINPHILG